MSDGKPETVTFETSEGTRITCTPDLARALGYSVNKAPKRRSTSK